MRAPTGTLGPKRRFLGLLVVLLCSSGFHGGMSLTLDGILLLSFKYSVLSDPHSVLSNWNYDDFTPCAWNGVNCAEVAESSFVEGVSSSRVVGLVLHDGHLLGSIPEDLGRIEYLRHLDLSGNQLNGTLPSSLFNASGLRILSLSKNVISGEIPEGIGNLSSLHVLNLSDNALIGRIPEGLGSLPNLTVISISNNYFFGKVSGGFEKAKVVDFSSNLVNGTLPENGFGGAGLQYLNLSNNRLNGGIPTSFVAGLPVNATVDFSYNNLTGPIPAEAASLVVQQPNAFTGNPGLCGKPLTNSCSAPSTLSDPPPNGTNGIAPGTSPPAFAAIPKSVGGRGGSATSVGENVGRGEGGNQVESQGGLKPATIVGIVVADLAGIGMVFMVFLYVYNVKWKKKDQNQQQQLDGLVLTPSRSGNNGNGSLRKVQLGAAPVEKKGIGKLSMCMGKKGDSDDDELSETTCWDTESDNDHRSTKQRQQPEKKGGLLVTVDGERELELETLLKASAYILGASGSSIVYKAVLADGTVFAVRRIGDGGIERFKEFEAQVRSIAKFRHPNLVRIRGFFWGADEKLLIHDYAASGSLANISYRRTGSSPFHLPWDVRIRIAKGVARGLAYLHEKKAVHGNLKPSNILLTPDMEPMLGDFGLDRLVPGFDATSRFNSSLRHFGSKRSTLSQSSLQEPSPSPCGGSSATPYHAPECLKNLKPSAKWDVYSFGVVLLELLSGRVFHEEEIVEWSDIAFTPEEHNRVLRLVDGSMRGEVVGMDDTLLSCFRLGFSCTLSAPHKRPSMKEAVQVLDKVPSSSSLR